MFLKVWKISFFGLYQVLMLFVLIFYSISWHSLGIRARFGIFWVYTWSSEDGALGIVWRKGLGGLWGDPYNVVDPYNVGACLCSLWRQRGPTSAPSSHWAGLSRRWASSNPWAGSALLETPKAADQHLAQVFNQFSEKMINSLPPQTEKFHPTRWFNPWNITTFGSLQYKLDV